MFFRNDTTDALTAAESATLHRAMHEYRTKDEVRFDEATRLLAPILNTLVQLREKFYLVHLPRNGGWVLRRHRPTGTHHARITHYEEVNDEPDMGRGSAQSELGQPELDHPAAVPGADPRADAPAPGDEAPAGEYAEERFGCLADRLAGET